MDINKLKEKKANLLSLMDGIVNGAEDVLSEQEQTEFDELKAQFDATTKSIEKAEQLEKARQDADNQAKRPAPARERIVPLEQVEAPAPTSAIKLPAEARRSYSLKAFKTNEEAYSFGQFIRSANGDWEAARWCADHGINVSKFATAHNSTTDAQGGYLVPVQYGDTIARLLYSYGVARRECNVIQMGSDTYNRPKRVSGLTAYPVTESAAGTESNKTWGQIQLVAKDWVVLSRMTRQLSADALISVADDLMNEIAYQFAYAEDNCLFNGMGTTHYADINGLAERLFSEYGATEGKGQVVTASTSIADLRKVISKLPSYARKGAKWYVSPAIFDSVFLTKAEALSGNTMPIIVDGAPRQFYMGYEVVLVDVMPSDFTDLTNPSDEQAYIAYFANLKQAVDFGDRQQTMIDFSDSAVIGGESVFERGQIAVRGIERFAMNVHSYGQNSEPTPIVGLLASA
jgi:HK97 family phage major capsid protein